MTENPPVREDRPAGPPGAGGFETLLAAAVRSAASSGTAAQAEEKAVAAFREARDLGAHSARTRRRDDWRPRPRGLARWSLRTSVGTLVAGLALGGVAMAGIGAVNDDPGADTEQRPSPRRSSTGAPERSRPDAIRPTTTAPPASGTGAHGRSTGHPDNAADTLAKCHAYDSVRARGKALESRAWQRFLAQAGGEAGVDAYCAREEARRETGVGNGGGNGGGGGSGARGGDSGDRGGGQSEIHRNAQATAKPGQAKPDEK
ncbi:hypothetical protein ACFVTY_31280 [Streptomyces sp. NPDC058067]|uniref:hypothetical protein n=1 Tax=Streptomyces sp. NPDC058067 TaxID=3346324 RepID=UPI0036F03B9C